MTKIKYCFCSILHYAWPFIHQLKVLYRMRLNIRSSFKSISEDEVLIVFNLLVEFTVNGVILNCLQTILVANVVLMFQVIWLHENWQPAAWQILTCSHDIPKVHQWVLCHYAVQDIHNRIIA